MNIQKVLFFGITDLAQIIYHFLKNDNTYEICGFVVDKKFMPNKKYIFNKPIIDFDVLQRNFSPKEYSFFLCVGYNKMNKPRKQIYNKLKNMGYTVENFIHKDAKVYTKDIGDGNIFLAGATIDPYTTIGNGNIFFTDSLLSHHSIMGNFNFMAVKSCITGHTTIKNNCFFGAHSTIKNGLKINSYTLVGANSYVCKDTSKYSVIVPKRSLLLNKLAYQLDI